MSDMNELNDEIILTINLMQTDIDDGLREVMQDHLACLLEIKRNVYKQRLVERSLLDNADGMISVAKFDRAPYKSVKLDGQVADEAKPMTTEELKSGGWWCADVSADALKAFKLYGLVEYSDNTSWDGRYYACFLFAAGSNLIDRGYKCHTSKLKQINRIGNKFYWCE